MDRRQTRAALWGLLLTLLLTACAQQQRAEERQPPSGMGGRGALPGGSHYGRSLEQLGSQFRDPELDRALEAENETEEAERTAGFSERDAATQPAVAPHR